MADKSLVIVESPAKAKTIGKFLGSRYKVVASVGHVRDLPKSKMGIVIEENYEPKYINIRGKGDVIKELKKEAKKAKKVFLATDPDREGEAISWHIAHILGLETDQKCRIEFNEITKEAIKNAVKNPRTVDQDVVDAQQARRVIDRLVGYSISPLLWKKVRRGLSAGRVQSVALKIICEREKEIQAFLPEEYWKINGNFNEKKMPFNGELYKYNGKKIELKNQSDADTVINNLKGSDFVVQSIVAKEKSRKPSPPFTTSSLQQDASTRLGFFTKRTMSTAQQLYEGIDIKGKGTIGLVTYIRTDSTRISDEAKEKTKLYIEENIGAEYTGNNVWKNKKKDIQDAHEAIRPTYIDIHPNDIKESLSKDQFKLYKLIWERYIASQMASAIFDSCKVDIENNGYLFKANGSKMKFKGFLRIYTFADVKETSLPEMEEGQTLACEEVLPEQHFTQPPARYTEAGLVKELEELNIGRPSTYVPIITTLLSRRYIAREKKSLYPTDLGFVVTSIMEMYFATIVDVGFTASLEEKLDDVEASNTQWKEVVDGLYKAFKGELDLAFEELERIEIEEEVTDELCENCGKNMVIKHGRFGEFLACQGYPECKTTKPIVNKTGVMCPECGKEIVERRSKRGRIFYGCSGYPDCEFTLWNKPLDRKCPQCESLLVEKKSKKANIVCSNKECDYTE